jgi:hypothetical protein
MAKLQYFAGLTFVIWGLLLVTPLYLNFRLSDSFVVIPIICLFLLTGVSIIKGKKYSWTLGTVLGVVLLIHFIISMFDEIFRVADMVRRYKTPEIVLFTVWTILILSTLYSVLRFLSKDVRRSMSIESRQYRWTLIASFGTGILLAVLMLNELYWI